MIKVEFFKLFGALQTENTLIYMTIVVILILVFRKYIRGFLDPLLITIIAYSSLFTVLLILNKNDLINKYIFYQLLFLQISFIIFLRLFLKKKIINKTENLESKNKFFIFYFLHTFLLLIVSYFFVRHMIGGIGFTDKLNAFVGKGLIRIRISSNILIPGQIILIIIKREVYRKKRITDFLFGIFCLFLYVLYGGKTQIIFFAMYIFMTYYFLGRLKISAVLGKLMQKKILVSIIILILLVGVAITTQYIYGMKSVGEVFLPFFYRIISEADIYFHYYPYEQYKNVPAVHLSSYYIYNFFRLIIRNLFNPPPNIGLGLPLMEIIYNLKNPNFGPNTRAEVIWQQNLGYFGIVFSFLTAWIYAKIRNLSSKKFFKIYLIVILTINADLLLRDFSLFVIVLHGIIFVFVPIYILTKILYKILKMEKINE